MSAVLLAGDWGSTNLRLRLLDGAGEAIAERRAPHGAATLEPGEYADVFRAAAAPLLEGRTLPILLCGMVGSASGWREAGYVPCPAGVEGLADELEPLSTAFGVAFVVPGVTCDAISGAPDVMRGEETQIAGLDGVDGVVVLPGTHAKWAEVRDGRVVRFATAVTGELRAALLGGGMIGKAAETAADDRRAYDRGLEISDQPGGLLHHLFTARSRVLRGELEAEAVASYITGVLIGHEVAAMDAYLDGPVTVVAGEAVGRSYATALERRGVAGRVVSADAAVNRGLMHVAAAAGLI